MESVRSLLALRVIFFVSNPVIPVVVPNISQASGSAVVQSIRTPQNKENVKRAVVSPNKILERKTFRNMNMPNLLWKHQERTIGNRKYEYVFGVGNPPELALRAVELAELRKNAQKDMLIGYVTPDAEQALFRFLLNPSLGYVLSHCEDQVRTDAGTLTPILEIIYSEGYFDMDNTLYIDEDGRKKIAMERLKPVMQRLEYIASEPNSPIWKTCLSETDYGYHLKGILRDYQFLWNAYYK